MEIVDLKSTRTLWKDQAHLKSAVRIISIDYTPNKCSNFYNALFFSRFITLIFLISPFSINCTKWGEVNFNAA